MRLLHKIEDDKVKRTKPYLNATPPPYGVLSHTWGAARDEVGFNISKAATKPGFQKVKLCAQWAREDGLKYIWVDSCCLPSTNSGERDLAITSMFQWYRNAAQCYVYLVDVPDREETEAWNVIFRRARWFKRGWTLQELLAPQSVKFYSKDGNYLGDKASLEQQIHDTTGIPISALRGSLLSKYSIQERLMWAAHRQTAVPEDGVFCLQGLFEIELPPRGSLWQRQLRHLKAAIEEKEDATNSQLAGMEPRISEEADAKRARIEHQSSGGEVQADQQKDFLANLSSYDAQGRCDKITSPLPGTCQWILATEEYLQWLRDPGQRILWLSGQTGAGKSTLAKFAIDELKQNPEPSIVISYFANPACDGSVESIRQMYCSLLGQLLIQFQLPPKFWDNTPHHESSVSLESESLRNIFQQVMAHVDRKIILVVDASNETQLGEVTNFLHQSVTNLPHLRVLLTRESNADFDIHDALTLTLEAQHGHTADVDIFLEKNLQIDIGDGDRQIRDQLCKKSAGVFLWAVLAVQILNTTHRNGENVGKKLGEMDSNINRMYHEILGPDSSASEETRFCLLWILYSKHPLQREEVYHAILSGTNPNGLSLWNEDQVPVKSIDDFITQSSKGLARIDGSNKVHFIHDSVRQFLLSDDGQSLLIKQGENPHDILKACCQQYLQSSIFDEESSRRPLLYHAQSLEGIVVREKALRLYPLLRYAVGNVFKHADTAQAQGSDQASFLESFDIDTWAHLRDLIEPFEVERYQHYAPTLLYILSAANHAHLVRKVVSTPGKSRIPYTGRHDNPIYAAIANNCVEAFDELTGPNSQWHPSATTYFWDHPSPLPFIFAHASSPLALRFVSLYRLPTNDIPDLSGGIFHAVKDNQESFLRAFLAKNWTDNWENVYILEHLEEAIKLNNTSMLSMLLSAGMPPGSWGQNLSDTLIRLIISSSEPQVLQGLLEWCRVTKSQAALDHALCHTAAAFNPGMVEQLLAAGANANVTGDPTYYTPLFAASAGTGNGQTIRLLLEAGAQVETPGMFDLTPLYHATEMGNLEGVQILIDAGANVNAHPPNRASALFQAVSTNRLAIFQLLLANGASPHPSGSAGQFNPLICAISHGMTQAVVDLLNAGAEVDLRTADGKTPLQVAVDYHRDEIARVLRERGAH